MIRLSGSRTKVCFKPFSRLLFFFPSSPAFSRSPLFSAIVCLRACASMCLCVRVWLTWVCLDTHIPLFGPMSVGGSTSAKTISTALPLFYHSLAPIAVCINSCGRGALVFLMRRAPVAPVLGRDPQKQLAVEPSNRKRTRLVTRGSWLNKQTVSKTDG